MVSADVLADSLARALEAGDGLTARHLLSEFTDERGNLGDSTLDRLARHASRGSDLAVELLIEAVEDRGLIRRSVRRMLLDEAAVDDVAQDVLVSLVTSIGSFRGDARFTTWLYQIVRRRVVDHLRRRRGDVPLEPNGAGAALRISSLIASRETVRQLVSRLPGAYRDAVWLRDIERMPYAEIAERLGRNLNTVKSHVARARAILAHMLEGADRD